VTGMYSNQLNYQTNFLTSFRKSPETSGFKIV
jgi:hypothetical protein